MRLVKLVALFGFWQGAGVSFSCGPYFPCWNISDVGVVFVGTPIRYKAAGPSSIAVDFAVSETLGTPLGQKWVTVNKSRGTDSGYPFRMGVEYLVFANKIKSELWTSSCLGTRPVIVATALVRQLRAIKERRPAAQIFGFIGTEPYPGVSPASRLEAKPIGSISITAKTGSAEFRTSSNPDGSFEFSGLPAGLYHVSPTLPEGIFIWFMKFVLAHEFSVQPGVACEADLPLYPKDDPFGANQPR